MRKEDEMRCALGLGANLADPAVRIKKAVHYLEAAGLCVTAQSSLYRTAPVHCVPGTPPFINAAITGLWRETPHNLLQACQSIEIQLGRPAAHSSRESRLIDIDILLVDRLVIQNDRLVIPHPRLTERLFVLVPLAEIAPSWVIPVSNQTIATACHRVWNKTPEPEKVVQRLRGNGKAD